MALLVNVSKYGRAALLPLLISGLMVSGCKKEAEDPVRAILVEYKPNIEPTLQEAETISKLFVSITLDKAEPAAAIETIKTQALPLCEKFKADVQGLNIPEPTVAKLHQKLVEAATLRVEGYQQIVQGYEEKNMDLFVQGSEKLKSSKISEETFLAELESLSEAHGVSIKVFADAVAEAPQ